MIFSHFDFVLGFVAGAILTFLLEGFLDELFGDRIKSEYRELRARRAQAKHEENMRRESVEKFRRYLRDKNGKR